MKNNDKKYSVVFVHWTGECDEDGSWCSDMEIEFQCDTVEEIHRFRDENFSLEDIILGKVEIFDKNGRYIDYWEEKYGSYID